MRGFAIPSVQYNASLAGTVYLQLVFWGSLSTFFISLDLLATTLSDPVLIPCTILLLLASLLAFSYICFHQLNARRRRVVDGDDQRPASFKRPVYIAVRLAIAVALLWLVSSGWNIVTAARQPACLRSNPGLHLWQTGSSCMAQRVGTAFSIINLLSSCALFVHIATTRDPFGSHLFGQMKLRPASIIPYKFDPKPNEKGGLSRKTSASSEISNKPLPKTPTTEERPLTPIAGGPIGLGISTSGDPPVGPPMTQTSIHSPSRHAYIPSPSRSRFNHLNQSSVDLPGFTPPSPIRRPSPVIAVDSAWRALHPPASHFRHVSDISPSVGARSPSGRVATGIHSIPASPSLGLGNHPRKSSLHSASFSRGHSHSRSLPHATIANVGSRSSSGRGSHRRGASASAAASIHSRNTSDPNTIIFAQLAAEMEIARKLERTLLEVGQKVELGKMGGTSGSSHGTSSQESCTHAESSVANTSGSAESESGGTDLSVHTASSGVLSKSPSTTTTARKVRPAGPRRDSSLFAEAEWHVLMGKERPGKRDMFF